VIDDAQPIQVMGALLCQDRFEDVKRHIFRVLPHVDHYVIVDNGSGPEMQAWLRNFARVNVEVIFRKWNDSFADARNTYLAVAERLAQKDPDRPVFIAAADDDELYSDELLADLRKIARWVYLEDCNVLRPFSMNADLDWRGDRITEWRGGYYKPLMFMWEPGMRYEDAPGHFHEDMKIVSGWRVQNLDDEQGKYVYWHAKRFGETWLRATRNFFAGGGGPNLGERNPLWKPFRELFTQQGITTSDQMQAYLRAGSIDPAIKAWFVNQRYLGTPHDPTPPLWTEWPDGTSEVREGFLAYFVFLHPGEMPTNVFEYDRAHGIDHAKDTRIIHGPAAPDWATA
jgi:glycosyltransferase involved in cell wall biosynthesis